MLSVALISVIFTSIFLLNNDETVVYNNYIWHVESDSKNGSETLVRGGKIEKSRTMLTSCLLL